MTWRTAFVLCVLVFLPSLLIRIHPTTSESFQYDAVISQLAAARGILANAWDEEAFLLRRHHPPLLSYIIRWNNTIFGDDAFRARIFSMIFGSLTCLLVAVAIGMIACPLRGRWMGAVFGGWLVALLPVHLCVSRTSNWDAVYGFFAIGTLLSLSLYLMRRDASRFYAAGLFGSLAFLTSELALSLAPAFLFVFLADAKRAGLPRAARRGAGVLVFALFLLVLLWPAGILKLDLARTLLFRWRDSLGEERNAPWYMFYFTLFRQAPAFAVSMVLGSLATIPALFFRGPMRGSGAMPADWLTATLPFWIYVVTVFALSLGQRLVYIHHIADLFPALVVAVCVGIVAGTAFLTGARRSLVVALGCATVLLSIAAAANPDPDVVGPQERPGFLGVRDVLRDYPGARVYCYDVTVLKFYLPRAHVEGGPARYWTPREIERVKRSGFAFVVFDRSALNDDYPTAKSVMDGFAPDYSVAWVIQHRRSGEPVAWVLARSISGRGETKTGSTRTTPRGCG